MYIMQDKKFHLISLALNDFCNDIESICEKQNYSGGISIRRILDCNLLEDVLIYIKENKMIYVIDMKYIATYENKIINKLLTKSNAKIIIVNIHRDVRDSVIEDLNFSYIEIGEDVLVSEQGLMITYEHLKLEIVNIYHKESVAIVAWMKQNIDSESISNLKPLDSSGVYCNMYVNAKRLFTNPDKYYFIIYQIVFMILENNHEIDALVSASRNGANIASIIGWLLNKKVIHCSNLGPKFSLSINTVYKSIRKNQNYVYIFDFLCLGTELKVLNALLSFQGANLVSGYGIANYINISGGNDQYNVIGKMHSLVDVQNEKFNYKIAGSKEEITKLLVKENYKYVSRLCRV